MAEELLNDTNEEVVETTETADTDADTTETADTAETTDDGTADTEEETTEEPVQKTGNWFETSSPKPTQKPKQKQMPDTVRARIESETRAKVEADYDWAKGLDKENGARLRSLYDLSEKDPIQFVDHMLRNLAGNPVHKARLFSYLSEVLPSQGDKTTKTDEDEMPGPDSEQGYTQAGFKKLVDWQKQQIKKEAEALVNPILQERQNTQQQAESARQADEYGKRAVTNVMKRPGFKENQAVIQKAYNEIPRPWKSLPVQQWETHPDYRTERELLLEAYYTGIKAAELDKNKKRVADLKNKAAVTSVNPGSGGQNDTTGKRTGNFKEDFRKELERQLARSQS